MLPSSLRADAVQQAASTVCNVKFDNTVCQLSIFPIAQGGVGLSSTVNVSLPAYASNLSVTRQLVSQILQVVFEFCPTAEVDSVVELHSGTNQLRRTRSHSKTIMVYGCPCRDLKSDASPSRLAHIITAAQSQSGAWITANPIA